MDRVETNVHSAGVNEREKILKRSRVSSGNLAAETPFVEVFNKNL
jgi:hypothetical protein